MGQAAASLVFFGSMDFLRDLVIKARRRVKTALAAFGLRVGPQWDDPHWRRGEILRRNGITLVLDVGANVGQYGLALRKDGRYRGRIVSFEPVARAYAELEVRAAGDAHWDCKRLALSDQDGTAEITVTAASEFSSFLPYAGSTPGGNPVATESVPTARLDSLALIGPEDSVLLKLDVQGFEARVLTGAAETLRRVALLECEAMLGTVYEGQPTFREIVDLVDDLGFTPISFAPGVLNYTTGALGYLDVLFARRSASAVSGSR